MPNLRMDRAATLYLFRPLLQHFPRRRKRRIPILMYHSISDETWNRHPYFATSTSPGVFAQHLQALRAYGYSTITLADAVRRIEVAEPMEDNCVVVTFDDGYRDFRTNAFPILRDYGFSATVFLPTSYIGESTRQFNGRETLTWSEIRELQQHGVEFGSHTVSHPQLRTLSRQAIELELQVSRGEMEQKLGIGVHSFAYPYAFPESDRSFVHMLRSVLEESGYREGVSTVIGTAQTDRLFLKRIPVNSWDDTPFFRAKLEGGYDWIHPVQYVSKFLKSKAQ